MALSSLAKLAENVQGRIMNVFIRDNVADDGTYFALGITGNVELKFDPMTSDADAAGREKQLAYSVGASAVLKQTAHSEWANVAEIAKATGAGHTLFFSDKPTAASAVNDTDIDAGTLEGFRFKGVLPNVGATFNGNGGDSYFEMTFKGNVLIDEMTDPSDIVFDA